MALPAGTTVINGFALTPDGALYVTTDPASAITGTTITATTRFLAADGTAGAPSYSWTLEPTSGFFRINTGQVALSILGTTRHFFSADIYGLQSDSATIQLGASADIVLTRDAAGTFAQRNGTNTQIFRAYHTYTDGSNYQAVQIANDATNIYLQAITAGTGGDNINIGILPAGTGNVVLSGATAPPAGGSTTARLIIGSTAGFGIYIGSGAPTVTAAKGSLYLRTDGSSTTTRSYINTDAGTTWTSITTAA